MRLGGCSLLALAGALFVNVASAQSIALVYVPPDGCPDEAWLRAEVMSRLGRDPFVDEAAARAEVTIVRDAGVWRGTVEVHERDEALGSRTLESHDCRELASAIALSLVVALDSVALHSGPPEPLRAEATPSTASATASPRELVMRIEVADATTERVEGRDGEQEDREEWDRAEPIAFELLGGLGATLGVLPGIWPRVELGVGLARRRFALALLGAFEPPLVSTTPFEMRAWGGDVSLAPCARSAPRFAVVGGCAALGLGRLVVDPDGEGQVARTWTASLGVRAELALNLSRTVALTLTLDGRANLRRPEIISDDRTRWQAPAVRGALLVGVRLRASGRDDAARTESQASSQAHVEAAATRAVEAWTIPSGV